VIMSYRGGRYGDGREVPRAVGDCAPVARGASTRLPPLHHPYPSQHGKQQLDSGLVDSGYLSSHTFLSDEGLSKSSLSSGPLEPLPGSPPHSPVAGCPKTDAPRLDSGVDLSGLVSGELSGEVLSRELTELSLQDESELSETERDQWQQRYTDTLSEAFQADEDGDTHLHLAIIYGFRKVAECLIRLVPHQNFLNLRNSYMQTPLHLAVLTGDAALTRHLLVAGADLSWPDRHGNTPLHLACQRADRACVHALTEPPSAEEMRQAATRYPCRPAAVAADQLDQWNYQGLSCLHQAILSRDLQVTAHLICHGANVNVTEGKSGRTPLHLAAETGDIELLRFLLEVGCGTDVRALTYAGRSAYQLAVLNGRQDVAELLLLLGAERAQPADDDMDSSSDSDSESLVKSEDIYTDIRIRGQPLAVQ